IQALKFCEQVGWKYWNPLTYNVVLNFGRFFNSFISLDSLFRDEISAEVFLGRSTKMQMYYVRLLSRPDSKDIIIKNVMEFVDQEDKLKIRRNQILHGLNYALSLENGRPSLTDCICAFYIVMKKKLVTWPEIEKMLKVAPVDEFKFIASAEISKQIELQVSKLSNEIKERLLILEELNQIRNDFFKLTDSGKVSFDFLATLIDDYVSRYYAEGQIETMRSTYKTNPHRLLQLLCRDLQSIYFVLIEGYIKVEDVQVHEVLIIQNNLFFSELDKINSFLRAVEAFQRKFSSFQYTFQDFSQGIQKGSQDQIEMQLLKILTDAGELFSKFAKKLNVILLNHREADRLEKVNGLNDKVLLTKEKPIDDLKIGPRFIPYYESKIVSQNRVNAYTVLDLFTELTRLLFNYSVIFKDRTITGQLTAHKKIEEELKKMYVDYKRLTGQDFQLKVEAE
ncbi:MAG: hypothetical protein KDK45_14540, partial [Leptospiraceae bacterium]|nr:hypothetical protein [Leptospiraceae bacterium]